MNTLRSLRLPVVLSVISAIGIVGMLLFEGAADSVSFALAGLPLAVGFWAWRRQRLAQR